MMSVHCVHPPSTSRRDDCVSTPDERRIYKYLVRVYDYRQTYKMIDRQPRPLNNRNVRFLAAALDQDMLLIPAASGLN